ncbi:MAG: hypothetical protein NC180_02295 [Muribaculaceae bacterium]|nr:hypothetical protein [Roseburia sp.]MCM1431569.1 hypothetical protein [Muribaculaceae bacterium]MCM1492034.1 hypothetical protein [Muribaculaceae bacterium]
MSEPIISERFDVDDIRKIREYNSLRHIQMTPDEIIAETKKGAERIRKMLQERKCVKA